jgi:hypothetical protein
MMRSLLAAVLVAVAGSAETPAFEYGNTYDDEDRAILAFPKEVASDPGFFTSLNGRKFAHPPPTVFAKPVATKVGYYCKSSDIEQFVVLELKPTMLYAFRCIDDVRAEVDCELCRK